MRKKLSMRKTKEIFRLHASGLKQRQIARSLNVGVDSINKYLRLAKRAGIHWPLPEEWDEETLRGILFSRAPSRRFKDYQAPDCQWIHQELKHKGVTLQLLHEEYKKQYADNFYKYTRFCEIYRRWKKTQKLSMRQEHSFGEEMFIDYAGQTVPIINRQTGESHDTSIFIAVLGGSNYTYAEATWDQKLPQWLGSHTRAFTYFEGVPKLLVCDNLKSGVSYACRYDPDSNPAYADMAAYYNTAILPARPYKPKDKPKAENGVLIVSRWILARLRHHTFYSLEDLNKSIADLLKELNHKPFQKIPGSRHSQFMEFEKPALLPLPLQPYRYAQFKRLRVGADYHVEVDKHYYSVPHQYARQEVEVRISAHTIEVFGQGKRIASHERQPHSGATTCPLHMLPSHRHHKEWSPEACLKWAMETGPSTYDFILYILNNKRHIRQVYRLFLGLLKLSRYFGSERLEKACQRAVFYGRYSYKTLSVFLEKRLDQEALPELPLEENQPLDHVNIRGSHYYQ